MGYRLPIIISIQGIEGSYHDIASDEFFDIEKHSVKKLYRNSFKQVFDDLVMGNATYSMVAIENSLVGSINEVYDLLKKHSDFRIIGEHYLRIQHNLLAKPGTNKQDIHTIQSHPMALAQCEQYLDSNFPNATIIETHDTAESAKFVASSKNDNFGHAAIASQRCSELFNLNIIDSEIEDDLHNYTRFIVLTHKKYVQENMLLKPEKTSIILTTNNKSGSLYNVLGSFAKRNINLSKLQSRPLPGTKWQYCFYIDYELSLMALDSQEALEEIENNGGRVQILGTYPRDNFKFN